MNPALPGGAPGDQSTNSQNGWQVAGRLSYAGIPYSRMQQGTKDAPNPDKLAVNVHLTTLQLKVNTPWQTELSVQMPAGRLSTSTTQTRRTDTNIGDAELRIKQGLPWFARPKINLGVGLVLPTGPYVAKSGAANLAPEASFLTLGRGVSWALVELQASLAITRKASSYVQLSARKPLSNASDDFAWGNEARAVLGGAMAVHQGFGRDRHCRAAVAGRSE